MRIQKYISQCGICSRREAEKKIEYGLVEVNGQIATIGMSIDPEVDRVFVEGVKLKGVVEDKVVLAMNKPKGILCTNSDPFDGKTVFEILPSPYDEMKLFCCGRLDKNSTGLVILTNDGDMANKITHPSSGIIKRYRVLINRDVDDAVIKTLLRGVVSDGEKLKASKILRPAHEKTSFPLRRLEIWLNQGRKREIRRMFEVMGLFVKELKRFQVGGYEMKKIPQGGCIKLTKAEIARLMKSGS